MAQVTDPVCGMTIDQEQAAAMATYQGQTYYFCAAGCKKAFEKDPAKYVGQSQQSSQNE